MKHETYGALGRRNYKLEELDKIFAQAREIFVAKNNDYGNENVSALGERAVFVRAFDKICRLKQLVWHEKNAMVKDEKVEDTYLDLLNYCAIAIIIRRGRWK